MAIYSEEYMEDGLSHRLFVRQWAPEGEIYGLVQICHGMAEHSGRYQKLGEYLADHGFAAFCHDHRGHGKTVLEGEKLGYFADKNGWDTILQDSLELGGVMRSRYPDGPYILFGHSMGSLIVSNIAALGRETIYSGFILCGSPAPNPMVSLGLGMAKSFCRMGLSKTPNYFLHALAFADPGRLIRREKSPNAWISSDPDQVDKYDADPLCGFKFTSSGFYDLFDGLSRVRCDRWAVRTECKPFLLISGQDDPVGRCGYAVEWIEDQLKGAGRDVRSHLYPGKRHEILNDGDCGQVYTDIMKWILEVYNRG